MIVATFILALFFAGLYVAWTDLSALLEAHLEEIGAGVEDGLDLEPPAGATAMLTAAGADNYSRLDDLIDEVRA